MQVRRLDIGRLGTVERTPQGGIRVPAFLSRTGIQEYAREDGSIQREWRPEEEVFAPASVQSAVDATVTDFHQGMVNPANYRGVTVGHVTGSPLPVRDGDFLSATMVILDANEIALIDAGERVENSCGYDCTLDMTPGITPGGEAYDCVQRNIVINHVALLPRGFGRAGADVQLRLDAKDRVMRLDAEGHSVPLGGPEGSDHMTVKRKDEGETAPVEGATTDAEVCATCGAPVDGEGKYMAPTQDAASCAGDTEAKMDALRKENATLQAKLDAATEKLTARADSKGASDAARARASIERTALKVGVPEAKLDSLDDAALKREVIAKVFPARKLDGRDAMYVEAVYDSAREVLASGEFRPTVEAKQPEKRADSNANEGDVFARTKTQLEKDGLR